MNVTQEGQQFNSQEMVRVTVDATTGAVYEHALGRCLGVEANRWVNSAGESSYPLLRFHSCVYPLHNVWVPGELVTVGGPRRECGVPLNPPWRVVLVADVDAAIAAMRQAYARYLVNGPIAELEARLSAIKSLVNSLTGHSPITKSL
jgi:hypothetical protein